VAFDGWTLRAETKTVAYPVDASVHTAMVRFAAERIAEGHLPWTSWFPYIALGSPQFLHYQSLAAVLTGVIAQFMSPWTAVAWTTYLLLASWPICVYLSGRLFSISPWAAAVAAMASPFLSTSFSSGYEQRAYIFLGYQLWTQLFAMWCLPIAWGLTWRALNTGKLRLAAAFAVAVTVCMHFETGYLALLPLLVWPWLAPRDLLRRVRSAVLVGAMALVMSAWVWVPLIAQQKWSGINSELAGTNYQRGYGARTMLKWLFTGHLFDSGSVIAIITFLGAVGLFVSVLRWRHDLASRGIITIALASFLLECGITTFGPLADLVPGHEDLFFRRFAVGVQLAWLFLAGIGLTALFEASVRLIAQNKSAEGRPAPSTPAKAARWAVVLAVAALVLSGLGAVVSRVNNLDSENSRAISAQVVADRTEGGSIDKLVATMNSIGPGRVYAGTTTNWGVTFTVGLVPVYKFLEMQGVDVMVYSPTTTTLMVDPEFSFEERNPGDYALFGVKYLMLPSSMNTPVAATRVATQGRYALWEVEGTGYARVVDTVGKVTENRADIGPTSKPFLDSPGPAMGDYLTVGFEGAPAPNPTQPAGPVAGLAGNILSESDDLASGQFSLLAQMNRKAVVVLSVTYDPGWKVWVDGRRSTTEVIDPALLGVVVSSGVHTVRFAYTGYGAYSLLFAISLSVPVVGGIWLLVGRRRKRAPAN
jgi:Bacterial membrane protein YfhO